MQTLSEHRKDNNTIRQISAKCLRRSGSIDSAVLFTAALAFLITVSVGTALVSCATAEHPSLAEVERVDFTPMIDDIEMLEVGDKAPLFEVSDVEGNRFDFSDRVGKNVIMLVFWSVYCDPCRRSMPAFNEMYHSYREKGLELYAVNLDGAEMSPAIRGFLADEGLDLTVLLDEPDGDLLKIADPYGVQGTPTIYIINKQGRIAFAKVGTFSFQSLTALVKEELSK